MTMQPFMARLAVIKSLSRTKTTKQGITEEWACPVVEKPAPNVLLPFVEQCTSETAWVQTTHKRKRVKCSNTAAEAGVASHLRGVLRCK